MPNSNFTILFEKDSGVSDVYLSRLRSAFEKAFAITNSPEFQKRVMEDNKWFAAIDNKGSLSGREVLSAYPAYIPTVFTVHISLRSKSGIERAGTTCNPPRINLYTNVIDEWSETVNQPEPSLINTIAHEMTHLIAQKPKKSN